MVDIGVGAAREQMLAAGAATEFVRVRRPARTPCEQAETRC